MLKVQFSTTGLQRIGSSQQEESDKAAPCRPIFLSWARKYIPIKSAKVSREDITSAENALCLVNDFAPVSGLKLNVKKTKALWLGKRRNNRTTPLQLSWPRDPVRILGIYFSYDDKMNDHYNFNLKIQKLQIHLDMWSSRNLTLFGKVLIIKSLGLSQILNSASNTNVPKDAITTVKRKLFSFL